MKYPTEPTLKKYGLEQIDYRMMYEAQGGICPICEKKPKNDNFRIDHEHVKGWKKMPPEKRKLYVRGLVCMFCNRYYLAKAINQTKARNIVKFLDDYAIRQKRLIR